MHTVRARLAFRHAVPIGVLLLLFVSACKPKSVVRVTVTPPSVTLDPGQSETFVADVTGTDNTAVTWSLDGAAQDDAITDGGMFTAGGADQSVRTVTVVATSAADPEVTALATVVVPANQSIPSPVVESVLVTPATATVDAGQTVAFTAGVTGRNLTDTTVTWYLSGAAGDDTISTDGVFTAGAAGTTDRVVTVVATSNQDDTKNGTATVTVPLGPPVVSEVDVTATDATVLSGGTDALSANVVGERLTDTTVTWSIEDPAFGDSVDITGEFTAGVATTAGRAVTIVATSDQDPTVSGSVTVTVQPLDTFDNSEVFVDASSPADDTLGPTGSEINPFQTIEAGLAAVADGGTVYVAAGTYTPPATLAGFTAGETLQGAGRDLVTIDARDGTGYGLLVTTDEVTLAGFTLENAATYGIKTSPPGAKVDGLTIEDVAVQDSGITEIDLNNVSNALLTDVIADGRDTAGVGVSLVSVDGVVLQNVTTLANNWGGVGIYSGAYIDSTPDMGQDITIDASNDLTDGVYIDQSATGDIPTSEATNFGGMKLAIDGIAYAITNPVFRGSDSPSFLFLARDESEVEQLVRLLGDAAPATLATTVTYDDQGYLQPGNDLLVVNGMDLQLAMDQTVVGSTVTVEAGTYPLATTLTGFKDDSSLLGVGRSQVLIDATATTSYGMLVDVNGVTLSGFTLANAYTYGIHTSPSTRNAKVDHLTLDGITVENSGRTEVDLNNVSNTVLHDVIADGMGTKGVGVSLVSVDGVVLQDVTTRGNLWGGVGVYSGAYITDSDGVPIPDGGQDISIDASNDLEETYTLGVPLDVNGQGGVYIDDEYHGGLLNFGDKMLAISGLRWMITSATFRDRAGDFILFARDPGELATLLTLLPDDAIVHEVTYDANGYLQEGTQVQP